MCEENNTCPPKTHNLMQKHTQTRYLYSKLARVVKEVYTSNVLALEPPTEQCHGPYPKILVEISQRLHIYLFQRRSGSILSTYEYKQFSPSEL